MTATGYILMLAAIAIGIAAREIYKKRKKANH